MSLALSGLTVYQQTGLKSGAAPGPQAEPAGLPTVQTENRSSNALGLIQPDNPVFWFGVVAAVTFGLIGFSTHARIGRAEAGIEVGRSGRRRRSSGDE